MNSVVIHHLSNMAMRFTFILLIAGASAVLWQIKTATVEANMNTVPPDAFEPADIFILRQL